LLLVVARISNYYIWLAMPCLHIVASCAKSRVFHG
jgi:hypothetical protein